VRKLITSHSGQSIVEYVVLLALVTILVVAVVAGVGRRSQNRVAQANEALEEAAVASGTSSGRGGRPAVAGTVGRPSENRPKDR